MNNTFIYTRFFILNRKDDTRKIHVLKNLNKSMHMFLISVIFEQSISYENIKDKIGTKKF